MSKSAECRVYRTMRRPWKVCALPIPLLGHLTWRHGYSLFCRDKAWGSLEAGEAAGGDALSLSFSSEMLYNLSGTVGAYELIILERINL